MTPEPHHAPSPDGVATTRAPEPQPAARPALNSLLVGLLKLARAAASSLGAWAGSLWRWIGGDASSAETCSALELEAMARARYRAQIVDAWSQYAQAVNHEESLGVRVERHVVCADCGTSSHADEVCQFCNGVALSMPFPAMVAHLARAQVLARRSLMRAVARRTATHARDLERESEYKSARRVRVEPPTGIQNRRTRREVRAIEK